MERNDIKDHSKEKRGDMAVNIQDFTWPTTLDGKSKDKNVLVTSKRTWIESEYYREPKKILSVVLHKTLSYLSIGQSIININ